MNKDLKISVLMDFYGQMLTEKQRESMEFYYNDDLSLSEISEHMGITRQGVRDFIKRGEKQLIELENVLGLAERFEAMNNEFINITKIIQDIQTHDLSQDVCDKLKEIEIIANKIKEDL